MFGSSGIFVFVACCWCLHLFGFAECAITQCVASPGNENSVCRCSFPEGGIQAMCEGKNLTKIPTDVPPVITQLYLGNNAITAISKADVAGLEQLTLLSLERNKIDRINRGAFENLYNLQILNLQENLLKMVSSDWFQHLPTIRILNISNNQIRKIEKTAFQTLPASTYPVIVDLGGNDMSCDCTIKDLKRWTTNMPKVVSKVTFENLKCSNRKNVKKNFEDLTDSDFPLCPGSEGPTAQSKFRCQTCSGSPSHFSCDVTSSPCSDRAPMCFSEVKYASQSFHIQKGCRNFSSCLQAERENSRLCLSRGSQDGAQMHCFFCCTGDLCNKGDVGGRTRSLESFLAFSLNSPFQRYMMESSSAQREREQASWTTQVAAILKTLPGITTVTTDVEFLAFRNESSKMRVAFILRQTTLYSVNSSTVFQSVFQSVRASAENGFLNRQDLKHIYVGSELDFLSKCQPELTTILGHELLWPETDHGDVVRLPCGPSEKDSDENDVATRRCVLGKDNVSRWETADIRNCRLLNGDLEELKKIPINSDTVHVVLKELDNVTRDRESMTSEQMASVMDILNKTLEENSTLADDLSVQATVNVLSSLLNVDEAQLQASQQEARVPERILQAVDLISTSAPLTNGTLKLISPHLIILAQLAESATFRGLALVAERHPDNQFHGDKVLLTEEDAEPSSASTSSIQLPPTLLASAPTPSRISMSVFSSACLFEALKTGQDKHNAPVSNGTSSARINSIVIAASVVGIPMKDLKDPLLLTFSHISNESGNPRCVFWKSDDDSGDWSTEGCRVVNSSDNITTCACDHMTNFALLMDVYSSGHRLSETDKKALSIISYVGCGISLLALILTLLTYLLFSPLAARPSSCESSSDIDYSGKLRRDNPSRILINLCLALLLSNLVFVVGMHEYTFNDVVACKAVAAVLHFALLSGICWMAVEAFYMYLALVRVFKTYFTCFLLKCCLVGWGIPLVIVMLTLVVNKTDNYAPLDSGICWLRGVAFYVSFVAPVCLVMLVNFTAFALVVWQLMGVAERSLTKSDSFSTAQRLRGAVGVIILLGLTWIFAVFAIDLASVPFYYLFAIFNSLQGLFIFVFYCVLKKDARKAWKRRLPCLPEEEESTTSRGDKTKAGYSAVRLLTRDIADNVADVAATPASTGTHSSKGYSSTTYVNSSSFARDSDQEPNPVDRARTSSTSSQNDDNPGNALNAKDKTVSQRQIDQSSNAAPPAREANSGPMTGEDNHVPLVAHNLQDPLASDTLPYGGDDCRKSESGHEAKAGRSSLDEECASQVPPARAGGDVIGSDVTREIESSRL